MTADARIDASDATLVASCLDGDHAAWDRLIERHGPLVWAVARRARLDAEDAADVFQNTWTIALEELSRLREPALFGRWIGRVARHQSMRVRRGYGIARKALPKVAREDVDVTVPDAELVRLEQRGRVHVALARIGAQCAALLELLYLAPVRPAYAEIAERLDMRVGSIGPTRARCLQRLRGVLEGGRHE
jgi:RNA polymerase sigma factor (sigma-70 family)